MKAERLYKLADAVYAEGIGKENALLYLDVHDALVEAAAAIKEMENEDESSISKGSH